MKPDNTKADRLLLVAIIPAILLHGAALMYNIDKTYDAFVPAFFADHYVRSPDCFTCRVTVIAIPFTEDFFPGMVESDIRKHIFNRYSKLFIMLPPC